MMTQAKIEIDRHGTGPPADPGAAELVPLRTTRGGKKGEDDAVGKRSCMLPLPPPLRPSIVGIAMQARTARCRHRHGRRRETPPGSQLKGTKNAR